MINRQTVSRLRCAGLLAPLLACADAPPGPPEDDAFAEAAVVAAVEWVIGAADSGPDHAFGSVSRGLSLDSAGRLYVPDGRSNQIRVYGPDGDFLHAFGRSGDGPGDIRQPCCLAFDRAGRLWVWNDADLLQHIRYDVFEGDPPRFAFRVPGAALYTASTTHTLPVSSGGVVHVAMNRERAAEQAYLQLPGLGMQRLPPIDGEWIRKWRLLTDSAGNEIARVPVPSEPPDSLALLRKELDNVVYWLVVPGSAASLDAHTADGFARAISSRYRIHWHDASGALMTTIARAVEGPPLTPAERDTLAAAHRREQEAARSRGADLEDVPIPERKHPLERLFFDLDGRLWVQRTVAAGDSLAMADVYAPDGSYLQTVRWPGHVRLDRGAIRGDTAYGVSLDELDVARVVKFIVPPAALSQR